MEASLATVVALLVGVGIGLSVRGSSTQSNRLLESKIDFLLKHVGAEYDPAFNIPADIVAAAKSGNTIDAIKRYRAHTSAGLKEAKETIDNLTQSAGK